MATAIPLVFGVGGQWLGGKFLAGVGIGGHVLGTAGGTLVGGIGGIILGNLLFPQESPSESLPKVGSYQTQTTLSGAAIPIICGTCRVAGNIIYLGDSHPYTIVHSSGGGGGKGIGGSQKVTTTETRYRRSFLIGICEGEADVLRIWCGKNEISTAECTIFKGDGNEGLATIVGEEFAHYKHLCCVWFEEYDLGGSDSVPMFTFEVSKTVATYGWGYVVDAGEGSNFYLHVIDEEGSVIRTHDISENVEGGVVADNLGHYFVGTRDRVIAFNKYTGELFKEYSVSGGWAICLSIDPDGKSLYVGDNNSPTAALRKYDILTGELIWSSSVFGSIVRKIKFDPNGTMWVCAGNGLHSVFRSNGEIDDTIAAGSFYDCSFLGDSIYFCGPISGNSTIWRWEHGDIKNTYNTGNIVRHLITYNDKVYAAGNYSTPLQSNIWRFGPQLTFEESYRIGTAGTVIHAFAMTKTNLFAAGTVRTTDQDGNANKNLRFFDPNLNLKTCHGIGFSTISDFCNIEGGGDYYNPVGQNPADILFDIITNKRYAAGISEERISETDMDKVRQHCEINELMLSIALDNKQALLDWIDYIQSHYFGYLRLG